MNLADRPVNGITKIKTKIKTEFIASALTASICFGLGDGKYTVSHARRIAHGRLLESLSSVALSFRPQ